ncbi:competence protein ComEC [Paenibacillus phyllosphaerae]|uniref:Competence protein ComEC n=1 Tax=Paenibacillus phyllosphaerae TaxID=274593 RepID=A0A7W5AUE1_9BACL|nr:ComEC/Rec2 family competence protein [Paenibacillus phyllosphaerae]MBB3108949.1 competence protein ComEC [Paenibacillus phyllosphaerae]
MLNRPIVIVTLCWILGSAAAAYLTQAGRIAAGVSLVLLLLVLVLRERRGRWTAAICLAAFCLAMGQRAWTDMQNATRLTDLLTESERDSAYEAPFSSAAGTIVSPVEVDGDRAQFKIAVESITIDGQDETSQLSGERMLVQLKLTEQPQQEVAAHWERGNRVQIREGVLERPSTATNFDGFDYRAYLVNQRIHWLLAATDTSSVHVSDTQGYDTVRLLGMIDRWREELGDRVDMLYPEDQSGYMKGLVLGITDDLDPDRYRQFSQLGLTHILAISGLHVAVFLFIVGLLLKLLRLPREKITVLLIAAVPFYVLISGGSPSVIRAGLMAMLGLAAARLGRLKDGLHLLAAAALLMLMWNPYMLHDVGFQLSFLVTAGLILGVPPARKLLPQSKRLQWLYDSITVTVVAQLASFPLTIFYFNQFNLLSLPANLVLVSFISFIVMPLGGASLVLHTCWAPAGKLVAQAAILMNEGTFKLIDGLSTIPFGRTIWATPPVGWIVLYYAGILLFLVVAGRRAERRRADKVTVDSQEEITIPLDGRQAAPSNDSRTEGSRSRGSLAAGGLSLVGVLSLLVWAYHPDALDRNGKVSFLDVGQGDSVLIRSPEGRHILVDGGGSVSFRKVDESWRNRRDPYEVGLKTVVPLLLKRGVQEIDMLVLSHLDTDHIKGLQAVVKGIPVKQVLWNGTLKDSDDAIALMSLLVERNIPMYEARMGASWQIDSRTRMTVLSSTADKSSGDEHAHEHEPESESVPLVDDQNGESVAFLLTMNKRSFLFAGDADAKEEERIIGQLQSTTEGAAALTGAAAGMNGGGTSIGVDVMKVSHHGSKTSSTEGWLHYWKPRIAVISVGRNNTYGHPNAGVLDRLDQAEAHVLRTDDDGEVQLNADAEGILTYRAKLEASNLQN